MMINQSTMMMMMMMISFHNWLRLQIENNEEKQEIMLGGTS